MNLTPLLKMIPEHPVPEEQIVNRVATTNPAIDRAMAKGCLVSLAHMGHIDRHYDRAEQVYRVRRLPASTPHARPAPVFHPMNRAARA